MKTGGCVNMHISLGFNLRSKSKKFTVLEKKDTLNAFSSALNSLHDPLSGTVVLFIE